MECAECNTGYHVNGKICSQGTITNCYAYAENSSYDNEICAVC